MHPEVLDGADGIPAWKPLGEEVGSAGATGPSDLDAAGGAYGRTRLLEGVDTFEIQYFGGASGVGGELEPQWQEEWIDQGTLPSLVRIRLTTLGQRWPDLIVALPDQYP
jgi:general secretion pathway protein J